MKETPPCLIEINSKNENNEGFSVFYREHYLYSKYNPTSTIKKIISSIELKPKTLILAFSPTLSYGLDLLINKLKDDCFILAIEPDKILYDFSIKQYQINLHSEFFSYINIDINNLQEFYSFILENNKTIFPYYFPQQGTFKYCLPIDFSGATNFYQNTKQDIIYNIDKSINQFWTNRLTLVHLGRLYSRNLFKNLYKLQNSKPLIKNSISKPILIFGAGESIEADINLIKEHANYFFIIAVDSALHFLLENSIIPNAVILVESQLAIEKAFLGVNKKIHLIADLTARPNIINNFANYSFFFSEFAQTSFIQNLKEKNILPLTIQPLGSVGIVAIELAMFIKKAKTKVFICGLDFSYRTGKTHCKEAPSIKKILSSNNRKTPIEQLAISFSNTEQTLMGKNNLPVKTIPSLLGYSSICKYRYSKNNEIFDIGKSGLPLGFPNISVDSAIAEAQSVNLSQDEIFYSSDSLQTTDKISQYYNEEIQKLNKIKNILVSGDDSEKLLDLINQCDYLFYHFADGYKGAINDIAFLKRVRSEIDFFIKDFSIALSQMQR